MVIAADNKAEVVKAKEAEVKPKKTTTRKTKETK